MVSVHLCCSIPSIAVYSRLYCQDSESKDHNDLPHLQTGGLPNDFDLVHNARIVPTPSIWRETPLCSFSGHFGVCFSAPSVTDLPDHVSSVLCDLNDGEFERAH